MGRSRFRFWLAFLLLLAIVVSGPFFWMPRVGAALIHNDGPAQADAAVVLAGDPYGQRLLFAAELARQGYVKQVLVSGPAYYDIHECDVAIQFAVRKGYPQDLFIPVPNDALSTREESWAALGELKRRGAASFLLVTSDYHTARSGRIYRNTMGKMGYEPAMRVVAAPDKYFQTEGWWKSRAGLKIIFMEWSKTFATAMGI